MKRKFLKRIMCASLALAMCLTGSISVFAEETTKSVVLSNQNGGVGNVESPVSADVSTTFTVKLPATIKLENDQGCCKYTGEVGIQGAVPADRAVSLAPTDESVVLRSGSEGASKTASVPVTQDQTIWGPSELGDNAMHCTNIHIAGTLDPGSWSGTLEFQVKINDITPCKSGHDYNANNMRTRCGALGAGLYSLDRKLRKSWEDLTAPDGIVKISNSDGNVTATIDEKKLTYQNILVVPGDVDYVGCKGTSESTGLITNLVLMDGVKGIRESGFANRTKLKSVTIPGSVKTISTSAFEGCSSLSSLTLGDGIETIGEKAFYSCSALNAFTMPRSVTKLGDYAFSCVPESNVYSGPFSYASDMRVTFTGTKAEWKAIKNLNDNPVDFKTYHAYTVICTDGTLTYSGYTTSETSF